MYKLGSKIVSAGSYGWRVDGVGGGVGWGLGEEFFSGPGEQLQDNKQGKGLLPKTWTCRMFWSSGLSSLLSLYQLCQRTNSSLLSTATYDPLIKSVISEAFGSRGKGKMVVDGERCLHVENGQKQPFFKGLWKSGLKMDYLGAQKLEPVVTHTSVPSLTFCPGEGSNMLTLKLSQWSLIDTARMSTELVTVVPHFILTWSTFNLTFNCFHPWLPWSAHT